MGIDLSAIFNILTSPPGDLIYHLVVTLALIVTMGMASAKTQASTKGAKARHILIGCGILFIIQMILLSFRIINGLASVISPLTLATIERLASALTVMWLVWTFFEHDKYFFFCGLNIFLSLAMIFMASILMILISLLPDFAANSQFQLNIFWQLATLFYILIGLILILAYRPHQWVVTAAMLFMLAAGHILQLTLFTDDTVRMGAVRFAQTLSLPWVMVLVQRLGKTQMEPVSVKQPPEPDIIKIQQDLVDTKPALMDLLLKIPLQETTQERYKVVLQALSLSVVSDICFLAGVSELNHEIRLFGYDLIREEFLSERTLPSKDLRGILDAWEKNRVYTLTGADSDTRDAAAIQKLLKYHRIGNLLAYPLVTSQGTLYGGIVFLSPYTNKEWGQETNHLLDAISDSLTQVLFTAVTPEELRADLSKAQLEINKLNAEINKLNAEIKSILQRQKIKDAEIEEHKNTIKQLKAKYQIEKLETVQHIEQLQEEVRETASQLAQQNEILPKLEQMETMVRQLTDQRDQLKTELTRAKARIKDLETQTGQTGPIRISMENQIISLDSIAANVRLRIAAQLQQKKIDLEIINPDGRQMIKTDPELLQTAIVGLLENAIEASDPGGSVQLNQKLSFETGMLHIQVTDHGEGLTQAEQSAFFSAEQVAIPGIGSVQSIRKAIRAIRVLNGKIWLRSKKHVFTTFRVQLPVRIID